MDLKLVTARRAARDPQPSTGGVEIRGAPEKQARQNVLSGRLGVDVINHTEAPLPANSGKRHAEAMIDLVAIKAHSRTNRHAAGRLPIPRGVGRRGAPRLSTDGSIM